MKTIVDMIKKNRLWLISIGSVLLLLGIWELAATLIGAELILPRLSAVAAAFGGLFTKPAFYAAVGASMLRCLVSFVIAFALGVLLGLLAGLNKPLAAALRPVVAALRTVPTLAIVLILMLAFGKQAAPVIIGVMMVFPIIYQTTKTAVENTDRRVVELARLDGAGTIAALRYVYAPISLPYILGAVASTFGLNIKAVISAEILAYTANSIGYQMKFASLDSLLSSVPVLFAWVIVTLLLSVAIECALKLALKGLTAKKRRRAAALV